MGDLDQTMKNLMFVFACCCSALAAEEPEISVDALKQEVFEVIPTLYGWCSKEKADNFIDLVLDVKPQVYVEIGVFGGSSLFPVASALKYLGEGVVIAIDPWDKKETIKYFDPTEDATDLKWWTSINFERIYYSYMHLIKRFDLEEYCLTMKMTSEKAAPKINTPIDILYIDGNHSEACSIQDVELYLPKVKEGGYIWMNDTLWASRQQAVELLSDACDVVKVIDNGNCILFKKR